MAAAVAQTTKAAPIRRGRVAISIVLGVRTASAMREGAREAGLRFARPLVCGVHGVGVEAA
jgi:hypothetical protein